MKIAIVGKMCSGKSTIANTIKILNPTYDIFSFGNNVKKIAYELFDMDHKDRTLLINIAKNMKSIDQDVWIKSLVKKIKTNNCIIDDVRHQNEIDYLIEHDWFIIHLLVDKDTQINRIKKTYPTNYQDHLNNIGDISENCDKLNYPPGYPNLYINTTESQMKIKHDLYSLLVKNN